MNPLTAHPLNHVRSAQERGGNWGARWATWQWIAWHAGPWPWLLAGVGLGIAMSGMPDGLRFVVALLVIANTVRIITDPIWRRLRDPRELMP